MVKYIHWHLRSSTYELVCDKLIYYPTVTREPYQNTGRLTDLNPEHDRFMFCGSPAMLEELTQMLDSMGFKETRAGEVGHYVIERAFVEK